MTSKVFGDGDNNINDDIVYHIALVMPLKELKCFSRTCRPIYRLAKTATQARRYETLSSNSVAFLWEFMKAIKASPTIANTTRCIKFSLREAYNEHFRPRSAEAYQNSKTLYDYLIDHVRHLQFEDTKLQDRICEDIRRYGIWSVRTWIVLMMLCPYIETLHFEGIIITLCSELHVYTPPLRTLKLSSSLDNVVPLTSLVYLASLPTIRTLELSCLTVPNASSTVWTALKQDQKSSKVEYAQLKSCNITPDAFALLVTHMPGLKAFRAFADISFWRWLTQQHYGSRTESIDVPALDKFFGDIKGAENLDPGVAAYVGNVRYALGKTLHERDLVLNCVNVLEGVLMIEVVPRKTYCERQPEDYKMIRERMGVISIRSINLNKTKEVRKAESSYKTGIPKRITSWWSKSSSRSLR